MTSEFESAKKCGYLKYSGGEQVQFTQAMRDSPYQPPAEMTKPHYVPTIKGAHLMTWKELWPIKPLYLAVRVARDRRLLQQTSFNAVG